MSEARRRDAIVKMATDPAFAQRVHTDPAGVAAEFGLDDDDLAVLESLREDSGEGGAATLDPRLSKSSLFFGGGGGAGAAPVDATHVSHHDAGGFLCDGHAAGFLCNGHAAGFQCNEHPTGFQCDGHPTGFVCDGHPTGFACDGHPTGFVCNEHAAGALNCNGHVAGFFCDEHVAGFGCNLHAGFGEFGAQPHLDPGTMHADSGTIAQPVDASGGQYSAHHDATGHVDHDNYRSADGNVTIGAATDSRHMSYVETDGKGYVIDGGGEHVTQEQTQHDGGTDLAVLPSGASIEVTHSPDGHTGWVQTNPDGTPNSTVSFANGTNDVGVFTTASGQSYYFDAHGQNVDGAGHHVTSAQTTVDQTNSLTVNQDGSTVTSVVHDDGTQTVAVENADGTDHTSVYGEDGKLQGEGWHEGDGTITLGHVEHDGTETYSMHDSEGNQIDAGGNVLTPEQAAGGDHPDMTFTPQEAKDIGDGTTPAPADGSTEHSGNDNLQPTSTDPVDDSGSHTDGGHSDTGTSGSDTGTDGAGTDDRPDPGSSSSMGNPDGDGTDGNSGDHHFNAGAAPNDKSTGDPETGHEGAPATAPSTSDGHGGSTVNTGTTNEGVDANTGTNTQFANVNVDTHVNAGEVAGTAVFGKVNPGAFHDPLGNG